MTASIILLGDSIFDNASYVIGERCVTEQLREVTPEDVDVSMLAVDGDYVRDVKEQIKQLPEQATHLFVSAGGNDALTHYRTIQNDFLTSEDLFEKWAGIQAEFRADYRNMLKVVTALNRHTAVCTIYDSVPDLEAVAKTALSIFNDVIVAEATMVGLPIVDLRRVCSSPTDYSAISPIEPSFQGGEKIARVLKRVFDEHNYESRDSVIYS